MYTPNKIFSILLSFCLLFTQSLYALPQNPEVVEGQASFDYSTPDKLEVTASSEKTIINYASFNIAQNEWVNFILPSVTASILNRVIGNVSSEILGKLTSNQGTLMMVNTAGINIAKDALIQAGGNLVLSTLDIPNQDFLNNHYIFERTTDPASIKNLGNLFAQDYLAIITSTFENTGTIQAKTINIAGADKLSLQLDPYIEVIVDKPLTSNPEQLEDQIKNTGSIESTNGRVYIEAQSLPNLFKNAINTQGLIKATAVTKENNEIVLVANEPITAHGTFQVYDGALKLKTKTHLYMGGVFDIKGSNLITDPLDDITINVNTTYLVDPNLIDPGNITITGGAIVTGDGCALTFTAGNNFTMDAGTTIQTINGTGNISIIAGNATLDTVNSIGNLSVNARDALTINNNLTAGAGLAFPTTQMLLYADTNNDGVGAITKAVAAVITNNNAGQLWFKGAQNMTISTWILDPNIISISGERDLETTGNFSITVDADINTGVGMHFFAGGNMIVNGGVNIGNVFAPQQLTLRADYNADGVGTLQRLAPQGALNAVEWLVLSDSQDITSSTLLFNTNSTKLRLITTNLASITMDNVLAMQQIDLNSANNLNINADMNMTTAGPNNWNFIGTFTQAIGTTITTTNQQLNIVSAPGGNAFLGQINLGTGMFGLQAGNVFSNNSLITAQFLNWVVGSIGTALNRINFGNNTSMWNIISGGNIYANGTGDLTIEGIQALNPAAGIVDITSAGDITFSGGVDPLPHLVATGDVRLQSTNGSIIDTSAPNPMSNIRTEVGANATLIATEIIGSAGTPIKVNIQGGILSISPAGQVGGVSAGIQGAILPINQVTLLNTPPGTVSYNGVVIYTPGTGGGGEPETEAPTEETVIPTSAIDETITSSLTGSDTQDPVMQTNQDYSSNILFPQDFFPLDNVTVEFAGYEMYVYCSEGQVYVIPLDSQGNLIRKEQRVIRAKPQLINLSTYQLTNPYDFTQIPYLSK